MFGNVCAIGKARKFGPYVAIDLHKILIASDNRGLPMSITHSLEKQNSASEDPQTMKGHRHDCDDQARLWRILHRK